MSDGSQFLPLHDRMHRENRGFGGTCQGLSLSVSVLFSRNQIIAFYSTTSPKSFILALLQACCHQHSILMYHYVFELCRYCPHRLHFECCVLLMPSQAQQSNLVQVARSLGRAVPLSQQLIFAPTATVTAVQSESSTQASSQVG